MFTCFFGLFTKQFQLLTTLKKKASENMVEKGEKIVNQHFFPFQAAFSPFHTMFSTLLDGEIIISVPFILSSANAFNFDQSEISSFGELKRL